MMGELLSLKQIARQANMSERTILKYLNEIQHHRNSPTGKIWIRWSDFEDWMERKARQVRGDDEVLEFLEELKGA